MIRKMLSIRHAGLWLGIGVVASSAHAQFGSALRIEGVDVTHVRVLGAADLDGDGFEDLVVGGDGFGYYPGRAVGTFGGFRRISMDPGLITGLVAEDLDGDGLTDLVVGLNAYRYGPYSSPGVVWALWNNGSAGFGDRTFLGATRYDVKFLQVVDIDDDGQLDVGFNQIWRRGLGARDFEPFATSGVNIWDALIVDLDGDGDGDAAGAIMPPSGAYIWGRLYENLGSATFASPTTFAGGYSYFNGRAAADIDGDGDLDLYATAARAGGSWTENLGALQMGPTLTVGSLHAGGWEKMSVAKDLDGDGDLDFASVGWLDSVTPVGISWFENLGAGVFGPGVSLGPPPSSIVDERHIQALDLDGDGDLDLVESADEARYLELHVNQGGGAFGPTLSLSPERFVVPTLVRAGDIDADGDVDVLSNVREGALVFHENRGFGRFAGGRVVGQAEEELEAVLVDLDGDADLDLVGLADAQLFVQLFRAGGYGPRRIVEVDAASFAAADMDADGVPDLVVGLDSAAATPRQLIHLGLGDGSFGPGIPLPSPDRSAQVVQVGDIDGDGDMDLAIGEETASFPIFSRLVLLEQVAGGGFLRHAPLNVGSVSSAAILLVDREGDGDLDVMLARSPYVDEFWNDGFQLTRDPIRRIQGSLPMALGDVDGDGVMDAVMAGPGHAVHFPTLYRDFGLNSMRVTPALARPQISGVALADIDGDGRTDLVAGGDTRGVAWYRNEGGVVEPFCGPNQPNVTSLPGELTLDGSTTVALNQFTLVGSQLPPGALTVAMVSDQLDYDQITVSNSRILCLDSSRLAIFRGPGQLLLSSAAGEARFSIDLLGPMPITGFGNVLPGDTLGFQLWYRDPGSGYHTSSYTSALRVSFD